MLVEIAIEVLSQLLDGGLFVGAGSSPLCGTDRMAPQHVAHAVLLDLTNLGGKQLHLDQTRLDQGMDLRLGVWRASSMAAISWGSQWVRLAIRVCGRGGRRGRNGGGRWTGRFCRWRRGRRRGRRRCLHYKESTMLTGMHLFGWRVRLRDVMCP